MKATILLVEDDERFAKHLTRILEEENYEVKNAWNLGVAEYLIKSYRFDLILLDRILNDEPVTEEIIEKIFNDIPIILISSYTEAELVTTFKEKGLISDFWHKYQSPKELILKIRKLFETHKEIDVRPRLKEFYNKVFNLPPETNLIASTHFIAFSPQMQDIYEKALHFKKAISYKILIAGPPGSGKRHLTMFIAGETLRELDIEFLHTSLTNEDRVIGFTPSVSKGEVVCFFDNLQNLQEKEQIELAAKIDKTGDKWIATFTVYDSGIRLTPELYNCFSGGLLQLPQLKNRGPAEFDLLLEHFLRIEEEKVKRKIGLSNEAYSYLRSYPWPGNLKELKMIISSSVIMLNEKDKIIKFTHLPEHVIRVIETKNYNKSIFDAFLKDLIHKIHLESLTFGDILEMKEKLEIELLRPFYEKTGGNITYLKRLLDTNKDLHKRKSIRKLKEGNLGKNSS